MGKTSFSGPVYGAKSLLWTVHRDNQLPAGNDTTTVTIGAIRVPGYEEWLVTEFKAWRGSSGSTAITTTFSLRDDGSVVGTLPIVDSNAGVLLSTTLGATAGEYEGLRVLANSTLSVTIDHGGSSLAVSSNITCWVYGFIRFISSSLRGEG